MAISDLHRTAIWFTIGPAVYTHLCLQRTTKWKLHSKQHASPGELNAQLTVGQHRGILNQRNPTVVLHRDILNQRYPTVVLHRGILNQRYPTVVLHWGILNQRRRSTVRYRWLRTPRCRPIQWGIAVDLQWGIADSWYFDVGLQSDIADSGYLDVGLNSDI